MKLLPQAQPPAAQEPAARATVMFVWLPWPEQPHSVSQSAPIQLPVQLAQAMPSSLAPPWPVQLPGQSGAATEQSSPTKPASHAHVPYLGGVRRCGWCG